MWPCPPRETQCPSKTVNSTLFQYTIRMEQRAMQGTWWEEWRRTHWPGWMAKASMTSMRTEVASLLGAGGGGGGELPRRFERGPRHGTILIRLPWCVCVCVRAHVEIRSQPELLLFRHQILSLSLSSSRSFSSSSFPSPSPSP